MSTCRFCKNPIRGKNRTVRNSSFMFIQTRAKKQSCLCFALLVAFGSVGPTFAQQDDLDRTYQQQLAKSGISDSAAVSITVDWLRAITQHALEASADERMVDWKKIRKIIASSERIQDSPRGILIRIQFAISELTRAAFARQTALAPPVSEEKLEAARLIFRSLITELQAIDQQSEKLLRSTYKKSASAARASGWTQTELESLRRNLALQMARTYRNQALCFPTGSPDSLNSLNLALQAIANLTKSDLNEDAIWLARLEQLACLRLLKHFSEARKLLEQWNTIEPSTAIVARLQQEVSNLDLAEDKLDSMPNENIDPTIRIASSLFAEGKHQQAIEAYDQAAKKFETEGDESQQFEAAQTAAAITRATGKHQSASKRFRRLALDQPNHSEAAAAHLVSVGLAASLSREAKAVSRPALIQHYVLLLEEHLQHWPQSQQADTVRLWLGRYWMSQKEWSSTWEVSTVGSLSSEQVLRVIETTRRNDKGLEDKTSLPLDLLQADALAALGKRDQALAIYQKLLETYSERGDLHESYGLLLSESKEKVHLRLALQVWLRIEKQSKPAGPRWLRARQARLELLKQLGKGEQAEKLYQLTKLLYPQVTDSLDARHPLQNP